MKSLRIFLFFTPLMVACSSSAPSSSPVQANMSALSAAPSVAASPVYVTAWPDAQCSLHPSGSTDPADALDVFADDLGVVTFVAAHAILGDAITSLSLDCQDTTGRTSSYILDLTSDATFQPVSGIPSAQWPANSVLPPLTDPTQFSDGQLIAAGYGLRPDPTQTPKAYAMWLKAVSQTTRRVLNNGHETKIKSGATQDSFNWSGAAVPCTGITGRSGCSTLQATYMGTTVPTVSFVASSGASIWGGLGGWNGDVALIQDGFQIQTNSTNTAMIQYAWKEYWSGNGVGGSGYATEISLGNVSPGDYIYAEAWACDSSGSVNSGGGYGCFYFDDYTQSWSVTCDTPSSSCASLAAINSFTGATAEAIEENNQSILSDTGTNTMYLVYMDSYGDWLDFAYNSSHFPIDMVDGSYNLMEEWTGLTADTVTLQWVAGN